MGPEVERLEHHPQVRADAPNLLGIGSAPGGATKADALTVAVTNLSSLSVYLIPLMALMLSFDALVGEVERGTMLLLMTYPVERWQIVLGKLTGHVLILCLAIIVGYGLTGSAIAVFGKKDVRVELKAPEADDAAEKPKRKSSGKRDEEPREERAKKPRREKEAKADKPKRVSKARQDTDDDEPTPAGEWNGPKPGFLGVSAS